MNRSYTNNNELSLTNDTTRSNQPRTNSSELQWPATVMLQQTTNVAVNTPNDATRYRGIGRHRLTTNSDTVNTSPSPTLHDEESFRREQLLPCASAFLESALEPSNPLIYREIGAFHSVEPEETKEEIGTDEEPQDVNIGGGIDFTTRTASCRRLRGRLGRNAIDGTESPNITGMNTTTDETQESHSERDQRSSEQKE